MQKESFKQKGSLTQEGSPEVMREKAVYPVAIRILQLVLKKMSILVVEREKKGDLFDQVFNGDKLAPSELHKVGHLRRTGVGGDKLVEIYMELFEVL